LPEGFEDVPPELRQLVEKEDAAMRERHLAGPDGIPAAEERRVGDRAVGRADRPRRHERAAVEQARDAVDGGHLDRLVQRERREDRRQPASEHRLPGPGRADQQDVVTPRRGDLERALRRRLPADVGEVARRRRGRSEERDGVDGRRRAHGLAAEMRDRVRERLDPDHGRSARERRLGGVGRGNEEAL
jgi:hypothetical protein